MFWKPSCPSSCKSAQEIPFPCLPAKCFRAHHQEELTLSMVYAYSEKYILPFGHEVVFEEGALYHKMPGKEEDKLAAPRSA